MSSHRPRRIVAVYLRISKSDLRTRVEPGADAETVATARHREALTSLAKQRGNCTRVAAERWPGATVIEFVDDGVSASKGKARAGMDALLVRLPRGDVAGVVVDTLDRITRGRGARELWSLAAACEESGAELLGASQELNLATSSGELSASIMAAAARYEAQRLGERVRATNALRRSQGLEAAGGPTVWGMTRVGDGVAPHPVNGPLLLDAIDRLIDGTATVTGLVAEFTARGIPAPFSGGEWTHRTLSRTLRRPALGGMVPSGDDVLRDERGLPVVRPGGLLDVERWEQLQAALDERSRTRAPAARPQPLPLLHGLAVDLAGHPLYLLRARERSDYRCHAVGCEQRGGMHEQRLDDYVRGQFLAVYGDEPETEAVELVGGTTTGGLSRIRREVATTRRLVAAAEDARDRARVRELRERLDALLDAEDDAAAEAARPGLATIRETGRTLGEALAAAATVDDARRILAGRISSVVVRPGRRGGSVPPEQRVDVIWSHDDDAETLGAQPASAFVH